MADDAPEFGAKPVGVMRRIWNVLKSVPQILYAILAAAAGVLIWGFLREREGEKVGAAKATAKVETDHVEEMVAKAHEANKKREEAEARGERPSQEVEEEAKSAAEALRNDVLKRVR